MFHLVLEPDCAPVLATSMSDTLGLIPLLKEYLNIFFICSNYNSLFSVLFLMVEEKMKLKLNNSILFF